MLHMHDGYDWRGIIFKSKCGVAIRSTRGGGLEMRDFTDDGYADDYDDQVRHRMTSKQLITYLNINGLCMSYAVDMQNRKAQRILQLCQHR